MEHIIIGLIIALIVAGIIVGVMVGQMKPVAQKHEAADYVKDEDVKILDSKDVYVRTDVSRRKIEKKN